jgi:two-component system cell cycle sensor histidine kinase/response regulator CckA
VQADPGQLEQVVMNLAVNARDAMPTGGKLIIQTQAAHLDEAYASTHSGVSPGPYVLIAVTDAGCGMSKEILEHIFEPFFTTKEPGKGTGLGLATVYGIVEQSRGHIAVASEPGAGTTFKVYLPSLDKSLALPALRQAGAAPKGSATILLVEDEFSLRELAAESLKKFGYTVLQAANGLEALALVDQHSGGMDIDIDIVVTDVVMPQMGGPELVEKLRQKRQGFAVIFMSGYTDAALENAQVASGAVLLSKPFSTDVLATRISEVLAKSVIPAKSTAARSSH